MHNLNVIAFPQLAIASPARICRRSLRTLESPGRLTDKEQKLLSILPLIIQKHLHYWPVDYTFAFLSSKHSLVALAEESKDDTTLVQFGILSETIGPYFDVIEFILVRCNIDQNPTPGILYEALVNGYDYQHNAVLPTDALPSARIVPSSIDGSYTRYLKSKFLRLNPSKRNDVLSAIRRYIAAIRPRRYNDEISRLVNAIGGLERLLEGTDTRDDFGNELKKRFQSREIGQWGRQAYMARGDAVHIERTGSPKEPDRPPMTATDLIWRNPEEARGQFAYTQIAVILLEELISATIDHRQPSSEVVEIFLTVNEKPVSELYKMVTAQRSLGSEYIPHLKMVSAAKIGADMSKLKAVLCHVLGELASLTGKSQLATENFRFRNPSMLTRQLIAAADIVDKGLGSVACTDVRLYPVLAAASRFLHEAAIIILQHERDHATRTGHQ